MDEKVEIPDSPTPQAYLIKIKNYRTYQLVYYVLGIIEVLLALRFFFKLLGANASNFFAMIIYGLTGLLMLPFSGLFTRTVVAAESSTRIFEFSTLIAMIVYALIAWGVAKFILIFKSKPAPKNDSPAD